MSADPTIITERMVEELDPALPLVQTSRPHILQG